MTTGARECRVRAVAKDVLGIRWGFTTIPGLLLLTGGFLIPMVMLGVFSVMHDASFGTVTGPATLRNYRAIVTDPFYLGVLGRTLGMGAVVTVCCACLGYPLAYFLVHTRTRWRGMLTFLMIMPLMISSVIRNIGWLPILGDHGAINFLLGKAGLGPLVLMNNMTGVIIALVHALLPFMTLMLVAVMQSIRREVEEAAQTLGASPWRCFWRVVFPLSRGGLAAGSALVFSSAVSSYTTPLILGGGKVLVMSTFIAQQIQSVLHYAFGSAFTVVLFLIALVLTASAAKRLEQVQG